MEFIVKSRKLIESTELPGVPHVVISITTSPHDEARIPAAAACLGILRLAFFLSRSPGVAAALARVLCGDDADFFARYKPNTRVYRLLLDVYEAEYT